MAKYKYRTERIEFNDGRYNEVLQRPEKLHKTPLEIEQYLNKLGAEGWELCSVIGEYVYIFKKRIEE